MRHATFADILPPADAPPLIRSIIRANAASREANDGSGVNVGMMSARRREALQ